MTHLIIHKKKEEREEYALDLINHLLGKDIESIDDLEKLPDIHILRPTEGSIKIEEVKDFIRQIIYKPFEEKFQIGLIIDSQKLTEEAQNALLKNLEEQPEHTAYILLVDNEKKLLDTILSRCSKHYPQKGSDEADQAVTLRITNTSIIEQFEQIEKLSEKSKEEIEEELNTMLRYLRKKTHSDITTDQIARITEIEREIDLARRRINMNGNKRLVLENMVLQMQRII